MNLQTLKDEFVNDPEEIGYDTPEQRVKNGEEYTYRGHWTEGNDTTLLELVNSREINGTVIVPSVSVSELQACVIASEFLALTGEKQLMWDLLTRGGDIEISSATVRGQLEAIWEGTQTLANITALYERPGSRAEELFGFGMTVSMQDVINCKLS
jgi:hypothetical protein